MERGNTQNGQFSVEEEQSQRTDMTQLQDLLSEYRSHNCGGDKQMGKKITGTERWAWKSAHINMVIDVWQRKKESAEEMS